MSGDDSAAGWLVHCVKEATTEVLIVRAQEPDGLGRMFAVSLAAHGVLGAFLLFTPNGWLSGPPEDRRQAVMTISLGGPPGPGEGGMTSIGGRPIQTILPLPEAQHPQAVRPPAPEPPEMTVPQPTARRRPAPPSPVTSAPPEARGRTPTRGEEPQEGSAMADTGATGTGLGLSAGGGGYGGYLDVGDFCCPAYLATMLDLVRHHWDARQQVPGETLVAFTIQRNGQITGVEVERSSGYYALDLTAQRALLLTKHLPPLPSAFTEDTLTVHLNFHYQL